jgi:hypothetical protein
MKIEFISQRKVVKEMKDIDKAILFANALRKARVKDQTSLEAIWNEVGKLLKVDPFLPLSIRIKNKSNKIVAKKMIWNNTL